MYKETLVEITDSLYSLLLLVRPRFYMVPSKGITS